MQLVVFTAECPLRGANAIAHDEFANLHQNRTRGTLSPANKTVLIHFQQLCINLFGLAKFSLNAADEVYEYLLYACLVVEGLGFFLRSDFFDQFKIIILSIKCLISNSMCLKVF